MRLGLHLGMGQNVAVSGGGGGGAFSPLSLSPKLWVENDPTKLYTDAGTTPVSADGQAVYRWADKSGNARHMDQTTSGQRPLYKDAVNDYVQFDGTDDMVLTSFAPTVDASGQCWLAFVGQVADITTNQHIVKVMTNGGPEQLRLYVTGGSLQAYGQTNASGNIGPFAFGSVATNTKFVAIIQVSTTSLDAYFNNGTATSTSVGAALPTADSRVSLCGLVSNFANAQVRGLVVGSGVLTSQNRTDLYTYLNAL